MTIFSRVLCRADTRDPCHSSAKAWPCHSSAKAWLKGGAFAIKILPCRCDKVPQMNTHCLLWLPEDLLSFWRIIIFGDVGFRSATMPNSALTNTSTKLVLFLMDLVSKFSEKA